MSKLTWIQYENIFLAILMKFINKFLHPVKWKINRINCEILIAVHIINICPHDLKRDLRFCIARYHILNFSNTFIAISALVKACE